MKITDEDDTVYDIDIAGGFSVGITGLNLEAFLGDDDGNPFTSGLTKPTRRRSSGYRHRHPCR